MEQVFLSYNRSDRVACDRLRDELLVAGLSVYRDERSNRPGDRWMSRLEQSLENCSAFVVLVGDGGVRGWVGAEVELALRRHMAVEDEAVRLAIFPVLVGETAVERLPPLLWLFQVVRWLPQEAVPKDLVDTIKSRSSRVDESQIVEGCPFLGLRGFQRNDAALFFGRRQETLEAIACLGDQEQTNPETIHAGVGRNYNRWLQVEGNSGTGKSSLVCAGILPMIEHGALWARTGFEHWKILGPMMPGSDPMAKLAESIELSLFPDPGQRDIVKRHTRLLQDERALSFAFRELGQVDTAYLLVVDQFEELFTFSDAASRKQVDALLASALRDPECPFFLITTVRADFLDCYDLLPRLQVIYNSGCKRYFLSTISESGLREIVEHRAKIAGLDVSEISALIQADAREEVGGLPLVEHALVSLWENREGNRLTAEYYRFAGGLVGILSERADSLLQQVGLSFSKGDHLALELMLRLTRVSDDGRHTRQRIALREAIAILKERDQSNGLRILQMLSGERDPSVPRTDSRETVRLVTISMEKGEKHVELIHETLIRPIRRDSSGKSRGYWPKLYDYIEENRERAKEADFLRQQLKLRTGRWIGSNLFGRIVGLAYWDYPRYRALGVRKDSQEGRFLKYSQRARATVGVIIASLTMLLADAFNALRSSEWTPRSIVLMMRFRLGYAPTPEFVPVPSGQFLMGEQDVQFLDSLPEENKQTFGRPVHQVYVLREIKVSRHEITFDQYDYYVWKHQGLIEHPIQFPVMAKGGRGHRPVVNVSGQQAMAYANWLGRVRQGECRLPTEAEWEYSARGRANSAFPWGDQIGVNQANCKECGSAWNDQSAPVGTFSINNFGLYDVSGNIWEWTCSAWNDTLDGSEETCAPDQSKVRVLRGGSWANPPEYARLSARLSYVYDNLDVNVGFRVMCAASTN